MESETAPDILHVHFFEALLKETDYSEQLLFKRLDFFRDHSPKFVYTVHDLRPHANVQNIDFNVVFNKYLSYVDLIIHHGIASINLFTSEYPIAANKNHIVCPHGDYLADMREFSETKAESRSILGLPDKKKIVLIFGQLQYKNLSFAEETIELIRKKYSDLILLLAGVKPVFPYNKINVAYYQCNNYIQRIFPKKNIKLLGRFSQRNTYLLFKSADVVFLPHNSGLTTGIIPLAATLQVPFVFPRIGVFTEQAKYCFAEGYNVNDKNGAALALLKILDSGVHAFDNTEWCLQNNWDVHAEKILERIGNLRAHT
jgi:hypothetical protein